MVIDKPLTSRKAIFNKQKEPNFGLFLMIQQKFLQYSEFILFFWGQGEYSNI